MDMQNYKDIGEVLKERRAALQLETRDIAHQLHIRAKYLDALEEGALQVLPGKVYARGYLRQYTQFLGLDADQIGEAFDRVVAEKQMKYFIPEPTSRNYQPGPFLVAIAIIAVFIVYMYWYRTHKEILLPPGHEISPVPERLLAPLFPSEEATSEGNSEAMPPSPSDMLENNDAFVGPPALELHHEVIPEEIHPETPVPVPATLQQTPTPAAPRVPLEEELPWLKHKKSKPLSHENNRYEQFHHSTR